MDIKDGMTQLTFKYTLSAATNAPYSVYALVLYEQDVEMRKTDGRLILRSMSNNSSIHKLYSINDHIYITYYINMSTYHPHGVKLSEGQKKKLAKAYRDNSAITIRLNYDELSGSDQLMLTKRQIMKLKKAQNIWVNGSDIKISQNTNQKGCCLAWWFFVEQFVLSWYKTYYHMQPQLYPKQSQH